MPVEPSCDFDSTANMSGFQSDRARPTLPGPRCRSSIARTGSSGAAGTPSPRPTPRRGRIAPRSAPSLIHIGRRGFFAICAPTRDDDRDMPWASEVPEHGGNAHAPSSCSALGRSVVLVGNGQRAWTKDHDE
jgi:hypothetical protein